MKKQVSLGARVKRQHPRGLPVMLLAVVVLLAGCHGDPNVRKQKYLESGIRFNAEGKYREAAIQYANALKIDKNFPEAHYQLAVTYVNLGQSAAAYSEFSRAVQLQPSNDKARIALGNLLLAGGKTPEALDQANEVLAMQPNSADVHALLSAIAARSALPDKALAEIQRALSIEPNRAAFHQQLALLQVGDPSKAAAVEEELKKSIQLDPKSVAAKLMLAAYYARNSRWPEAEQTCREAIATDSKSLAARETLAQLLIRQGKTAQAEDVYRQAAKDLPDDTQAVRLLADYYTESRQLDKAKAEFASLAARYPKTVSLQKAYIRVLLQSRDYATAQTAVTELLKTTGKDPEVAALNGIVMLNNGKVNEAVDALQAAVRDYPRDGFTQFWLGKAAEAKGDNALAQRSFRSAVDLNPSALDAEEELARSAGQMGDMNLLSEVAEKTISVAPRFAGGYVWQGMAELNRGNTAKAEADLKMAMSLAPHNANAFVLLGKLRLAQKQLPEGVSLLEQALENDPNNIEAMQLLLRNDIAQKHPDKALARLNIQIAKVPNNSSYYDLLAELQIRNKRLDLAEAAAQKAMQINSSDGQAVIIYAQLQVQRGQLPNAIKVWEQWLNSHPNNANALAMLGELEEGRGDRGKAEAYYRKAVQSNQRQPLATNNLAYMMLQNGENVDVALTYAQTAREVLPNSPISADTLAWAYYCKGVYGFARNLLEDAVVAKPDSATMQYHLGMVDIKLGDKNNAILHLKKAATLAAGTPTALQAQAALHGMN